MCGIVEGKNMKLKFSSFSSIYNASYLLIQEAKEKFQQLQKVISILGDDEKRAVYDQTGCVDDAVSKSVSSFFLFM